MEEIFCLIGGCAWTKYRINAELAKHTKSAVKKFTGGRGMILKEAGQKSLVFRYTNHETRQFPVCVSPAHIYYRLSVSSKSVWECCCSSNCNSWPMVFNDPQSRSLESCLWKIYCSKDKKCGQGIDPKLLKYCALAELLLDSDLWCFFTAT